MLFVFFIHNNTNAQLHADFSASVTEGCSPLVVRFTDLSTGNPTSWRWDLGNGTISTLQHPTASYFNPGTYSVKLVVRNGANADSVVRQQLITIFPKPVASFTGTGTAGCFPHTVQFTDASLPVSGTLSSWLWDFGDGTTSTQQNPSHTYTIAGNFTVTLRVTNSHGCTEVFSIPSYVSITQGVKADFTNTTAQTCEANPTIQFTNTSTGPGNLSFEWQFGDGGVSAEQNPSHTYTAPGSYTVMLVVISPQGCRDTIRKPNLISVGTINSTFTSPDSVCVGSPASFVNTTSPVPGVSVWHFGDGTTATGLTATHVYTTAGTYTVKLVNDFGACKDSITREIKVNPKPPTGFTASAMQSCQAPFNVSFTPAASGNYTYEWNFGDGGTSSASNPSHTYTAPGVYTVQLVVTNASGCRDTLTRTDYINIELPEIAIEGFPVTGCVPATVHPTASVTVNEPVASYLWNFGDGTTSSSATPAHTYTRAGTYDVSLTITTVGGCTRTVTINRAVRVGVKPNADFSALPPDVCASDPVQFTDNSTGDDIDEWFWDFGDGGTSNLQHPSHLYSDTGYFSVTLIVMSNTCADTIRYTNIVHIKPPIALFDVANNCTDKYSKQFTDRSIGPETWFWEFGDGQTSTQQHPLHTYASPGTYTVMLTVTNGSCSHRTTRTVRVIDEKAAFTPASPEVCRNTALVFTANGINSANIQSWQWTFGDGTPVSNNQQSVSHTYTNAGTYTVKLVIVDALGCVDSIKHTINVYGATAAFLPSAPAACIYNPHITFNDQSVTDGQHPITSWEWDYGNGITEVNTAPPFGHTYATAGTYTVSLTVTDSYGCKDKVSRTAAVIISKPVADFYSPDTASCIGKPVSFINNSWGVLLNYTWDFGDGQGATSINPVHNYSNTGLYPVKLVVVDLYGCRDSITKPDYINISMPQAGFTVSDSVGTCPPLEVRFTNTAVNARSITWDFGDGNTSVLTDPVHTYTLPGIYFAKQIITGPGGCQDSAIQRIELKGPSGTFSYTPLVGCNPLTVTFTATASNAATFLWDFTDGTTELTSEPTITHTYATAGEYIPRIILRDAAGCAVPVQGLDTIKLTGVVVDFFADRPAACDQLTVNFSNTTVSNDYITGWLWSFGDGTTSTDAAPQHFYAAPGDYDVKLVAQTQTGCSDSLTLPAAVRVYPRPLVAVQGATESCVPAEIQFAGLVNRGDAASLQWDWQLGNGNTASVQQPPLQTYATAATYNIRLIATDTNNCHDTTTHTLIVHPLPVVSAGPDLVACLGTPLPLRATGASTYLWQPAATLSCDDCAAPLAIPQDDIQYIVEGVSAAGCRNKDTVAVRVRKPFVMETGPGDTLCVGQSTRLSASGADSYTWSPSAGLSSTSSPRPQANPTTTTTYRVIGRDIDNCFADTADILVKVHPIPQVEAGPDQTLAVGSAVQLRATGSADVTAWRWSPAYNLTCIDCPAPSASPRQTTKYVIDVTNEGGCSARDELTVYVVCNNGNLFVPNTFSPNGNGMNEVFYPRGKGLQKIRSFRVFNRWGELVFEAQNFNANDAAAGWDGTYRGKKLAPDVFVYSIEVVCENNEILSYKGDVTLLR